MLDGELADKNVRILGHRVIFDDSPFEIPVADILNFLQHWSEEHVSIGINSNLLIFHDNWLFILIQI